MSGKNENPIINQTINIKTVKCSMPPTESSYMMCEFVEEQGIVKRVENVAFFNFEAAVI